MKGHERLTRTSLRKNSLRGNWELARVASEPSEPSVRRSSGLLDLMPHCAICAGDATPSLNSVPVSASPFKLNGLDLFGASEIEIRLAATGAGGCETDDGEVR